ncbi:MAG: MarR family transcriptional regulator [Novosphingobium sp.]|nr:MarR family transcriptional regulator [Novosphingobium sp.]
MIRNSFDRQVAGLNVTRSQWSLIAAVSRHPGATQRIIAEILEISEASAGRLIDRLCNDGLLERRPREDDRRAHAIYLTSLAEPLMTKLTTAARVLEDKVFAGLSDEELGQLVASLDKMYANLSGINCYARADRQEESMDHAAD